MTEATTAKETESTTEEVTGATTASGSANASKEKKSLTAVASGVKTGDTKSVTAIFYMILAALSGMYLAISAKRELKKK